MTLKWCLGWTKWSPSQWSHCASKPSRMWWAIPSNAKAGSLKSLKAMDQKPMPVAVRGKWPECYELFGIAEAFNGKFQVTIVTPVTLIYHLDISWYDLYLFATPSGRWAPGLRGGWCAPAEIETPMQRARSEWAFRWVQIWAAAAWFWWEVAFRSELLAVLVMLCIVAFK